MKKLTILTLMVILALPALAQSGQTLRVYQSGGVTDTLVVLPNSSIYHSHEDLSGNTHDDIVSVIVKDANGPHRYMLSDIDSLIMPNGRRVVFFGSTKGQTKMFREFIGLPDDGNDNAKSPRKSYFDGTFPGKGSGNVTFYWTENDRIRLDVGYESRAERLTSNNRNAEFLFDGADLDGPAYTVYYPGKTVTIPSIQNQTGADNTSHVGVNGDCGTATATRNNDGSYAFTLEHKAAYLCFLPHIDYLPSVRINKIKVTCNDYIAGDYQLSTAGLYSPENASNTITLNLTQPPKTKDFLIGHNANTEQDSCAAYMVIAPQNGSRSFTVSYFLTDTLSRMDQVYNQSFSFQPLANTVYPITCNIPESVFRSVDLGFSHVWSNVNVGGNLPNEEGNFYTHEAAEAALTDTWQLPDEEDISELIEQCSWEWGTYNGTKGWFITGTNNGNEDIQPPRIFLPLSGYQENGVSQQVSNGYYWLASDDNNPQGQSQVLTISRSDKAAVLMNSTLAMSARPVKDIAREFRIPYSGTDYVDLRTHGPGYSIKVYDHAGPNANYSNSANGYLRITCAEGYKLNVTGTVNTESVGCDWIALLDTDGFTSTEVGRTGGNTTMNLTSNTNDILLWFRSDGGTVRLGLDLTVTIQRMTTDYNIVIADVEGGTMTASKYIANPEDTVILSSVPAPGYVLHHIKVETEGSVLTLYEDDPRLFQSASSAARHYLMCDTVRVRDGNWWHDTSHFLMPYSNVTVTPVFVNDDSDLWLNMAGNDTTFVDRKYLQRLLDNGMSKFRFYDYAGKNGNYENYVNGYMFIDAPAGYLMTFSGSTTLEGADHLYIHDGYDKSYQSIADPHGSFTVSTHNNVAFSHFYTDRSVVYSGYDVVVTLEKDDLEQYNIPHKTVVDLTEEHMRYLLDKGVTSMKVYNSNGAANNYSNSNSGSLRFNMPEGYHVRVTGTSNSEGCDYLRIYDNEVEKVARSGLSQTIDFTSESRKVRLYFYSDGSVTYNGVDLTVEFIRDE